MVKKDPFLYALIGCTGLVLVGFIWLVVSILPDRGPPQVPAFRSGQMVKMAAFGTTGMVVSSRCPRSYNGAVYACTYSVRFSSIQMNTNVSLFGADGAIDVAPIALVHGIREFELQSVQ